LNDDMCAFMRCEPNGSRGQIHEAATLTPWTTMDYRKYDVNVNVNIITKEDIGLVE